MLNIAHVGATFNGNYFSSKKIVIVASFFLRIPLVNVRNYSELASRVPHEEPSQMMKTTTTIIVIKFINVV